MEFPENRSLDCSTHGKQRPAFVCQHLAAASESQRGLGFFQPAVIDLSQWDAYNAWCSACDEILSQQHGEWNDISEAFAKPKLICLGCLRVLYSRHALSSAHGVPP